MGLEHDRRRRREKGARQGRKRGGEPAIEFAKSGECVFEWAMKNLTPATISRSKKSISWLRVPRNLTISGDFLAFSRFFRGYGVGGDIVQEEYHFKKRLRTGC